MEPQHCLENIFFNHPVAKFYAIPTTLRLVIQKRIFLVYNILFFLEEVLEQVGNNPHKELKTCILRLLCDLRQAKLFPTVDSLSESSTERNNHRLKKILKSKILKICSIVQFECAYAAAANYTSCHCQQLFVRETDNWIKRGGLDNVPNLQNIVSNEELCFDCIYKKNCNHTPSKSNTYQFYHLLRNNHFRPIWKNI